MGLISCSYVDKAKALVGFGNDKAEAEEDIEAVDEFEEYGYLDAIKEVSEDYGYEQATEVVEDVYNYIEEYSSNYDYDNNN